MSEQDTATPAMVELAGRPHSVLEEEREFFLRSLRDLEAEHAAGDIDDVDYESLKDDYTMRAASVLRQLAGGVEGGVSPPPDPSYATPGSPGASAPTGSPSAAAGRRKRWSRRAVGGVAALAVGSLAGWALTSATGTRLPGQTVSGTAIGAEKIAQLLGRAQKAAAKGDAIAALKDCRTILNETPNQPQALAEEGWLLAQTSQPSLEAQGLGDLTRAVALAPGDSTAHLYRGIVLLDLGRRADAVTDLQWYLAHNPDPQVKSKVEQALAQVTTPAAGATTPAASGSPTSSVP